MFRDNNENNNNNNCKLGAKELLGTDLCPCSNFYLDLVPLPPQCNSIWRWALVRSFVLDEVMRLGPS